MIDVGWITFHRWVFDEPHSLGEVVFPNLPGAVAWHAGPDSPLGEDGQRTGTGTSWACAGFFAERSDAEAALDSAETLFAEVPAHSEAFHALLRPIRFAGVCHWLTDAGAAFRPASEDPGGPVVVLTSAGYDISPSGPDASQIARMKDFRTNVDAVRDWYDTLDGNIVAGNFATGGDGMTFTLWRSDADLTAAAYGAGAHRTQLDRQRAEGLADRTSYTRTRVLRHMGHWDGRDPVAEVA